MKAITILFVLFVLFGCNTIAGISGDFGIVINSPFENALINRQSVQTNVVLEIAIFHGTAKTNYLTNIITLTNTDIVFAGAYKNNNVTNLYLSLLILQPSILYLTTNIEEPSFITNPTNSGIVTTNYQLFVITNGMETNYVSTNTTSITSFSNNSWTVSMSLYAVTLTTGTNPLTAAATITGYAIDSASNTNTSYSASDNRAFSVLY